jgi:glycosyltransferase involved in cell wall biosynthesis
MRLLYLSPDYPHSTHHFLRTALQRVPDLELTWCSPAALGGADLTCGSSSNLYSLLDRRGWLKRFDAALYVEARGAFLPRGLHRLPFPVAGYFLDNDRLRDWAQAASGLFDKVFTAQRSLCEQLQQRMASYVEWVPFAADPSAYQKLDLEKDYDIGFVGQVTPLHSRRGRLLELLGRHFRICSDYGPPAVASRVYSSSRLVFNCTVYGEITVRTFEAMACGSCLLTDPSRDGSLETLFQSGKHLLTFKDDSLVETVREKLHYPEEVQQIADAGHRELVEKHTYDHRARQIVKHLSELCGQGVCRTPSRRQMVMLHLETEILARRWSNLLWQHIPHPFWGRVLARLRLGGRVDTLGCPVEQVDGASSKGAATQ